MKVNDMNKEKSQFQNALESTAVLVLAEVNPPKTGDIDAVRAIAKNYEGCVDALGISDNRDEVRMSALATASIVQSEGLTPVLHMVTRDRNRIALFSDILGAHALGIRNLLITSGTHQTLGQFKAAKNVFDVDSTQLLQMVSNPRGFGGAIGEENAGGLGSLRLFAAADPYGDPVEMQVMRLAKKIEAGAGIIITKPVFEVDRFRTWWEAVKAVGLHKKAVFIAGIKLLKDAQSAAGLSKKRPDPVIPPALLDRIKSKQGKEAERAEGIKIAVETIEGLGSLEGLRGFEICGDGDDAAVPEIIKKSGLRK
jgi:5,10-methylenetetrahydrofolate reductase